MAYWTCVPMHRPILCRLAIALSAICAGAASAVADDTPEGTTWRAVFLFEAPLIVEFDVLVGLKSIEQQRQLAAETAVKIADADGDGRLSRDEMESGGALPIPGPALDQNWAIADADDDGHLVPDEFAVLLDRIVGPPVRLEEEAERSFASLSLERLLDGNRDGRVEPDEWTAGWKRLARVDFDDDDTLSAAELSTFVQAEGSEEDALPGVLAAGDDKLAATITRLADRSRTDRGWAGRRWAEIVPEGKPITPDAVEEWVRTAEPDLVAKIRLADGRGSYLLIEPGPARLRVGRVGRQRRKSRVEATLARAKVEFRVANSGFLASDSKAFLLTQARIADQDQNDLITADEFQNVARYSPVDFATLDDDGDMAVTFDEIADAVDAIQSFAQLQVRVGVLNIAQNLFERLDVDIDRRLSPRELSQTAASQSVDLSQMETAYRLTAETDAVNLLPTSEMTGMQRQLPVVRDRLDGPGWFQKMDRNRDGDIAWREFLGPREAFDRLDRDADGLISVREADQE